MLKEFIEKELRNLYEKHREDVGLVIKELYGNNLSLEEVLMKEKREWYKLVRRVKERVKLKESPIDIDKLAFVIQMNWSSIGCRVITPYKCHFCGKEEMWSTSDVPKICKECAKEIAKYVAKNYERILKDK